MEITKEYAVAYVEVLEVLKFLEKEQFNKIPKERIEIYETYKDKNYKFKYDKTKTLEEQITEKTKAVLANLFVRFLAEEEERKQIYEKDRQRMFEEEKQKTWDNLNPLFKDKKHINIQEETNSKMLIDIKPENIFGKIIKRIKLLFGGKNNE